MLVLVPPLHWLNRSFLQEKSSARTTSRDCQGGDEIVDSRLGFYDVTRKFKMIHHAVVGQRFQELSERKLVTLVTQVRRASVGSGEVEVVTLAICDRTRQTWACYL